MQYQWHVRAYRRRFQPALQTAHGLWLWREGILLRLVDAAGNIGWGEIAPIPWFGSETLEQAWSFCHQLPSALSEALIFSIPDALPCCQFAFESAWEGLRGQAIGAVAPQRRGDAEGKAASVVESLALGPQSSIVAVQNWDVAVQTSIVAPLSSTLREQTSIVAVQNSTLPPPNSDIAVPSSTLPLQNSIVEAQSSKCHAQSLKLSRLAALLNTQNSPLHPSPTHSALLPASNAALHAWVPLWEQGFRTFKWKIGVQPIATELELLHELTQTLPPSAKLRLDANGGLSLHEARQWLQVCDAIIDNPNHSAAIEYIEQPLAISQFQAMQDLSRDYRTSIALDESVATLKQLQTCYANGWRGIFVIKPAIVGSPTRLRQFCQEHAIDAVFSSALETAIGRQAGLQLAEEVGNPRRAMGYGTTHWFDDADVDDFEQLWQTL